MNRSASAATLPSRPASPGFARLLTCLLLCTVAPPAAHTEEPALPRLLQGLQDPTPKTRAESVTALRNLALSGLGWHLLPLLADPDPAVRDSTVEALVSFQNPNLPLAALAYRSEAKDLLRKEALRVLARIPRETTVTALLERLAHEPSVPAKLEFARALCQLHSPHNSIRQPAPKQLGPNPLQRIEGALTELLQTLEGEAAATLCSDLVAHGIRMPGLLETTVRLAQNHPAQVESVIRACVLEARTPKEAIPQLVAFLQIGQKESAPAYIELRSQAAQALLQAELSSDSQETSSAFAALHAFWVTLPTSRRDTPDLQPLLAHFYAAPGLPSLLPTARTESATLQAPQAAWAEAILVTLAARSANDPKALESQRLATEALQTGWKTSPARRKQILEALLQTRTRVSTFDVALAELTEDEGDPLRPLATRVLSEHHLNAEQLLGLDQPGPLVKSLPFEEALRLANQGRGRKTDGQRLFEKQNCADCHALAENGPRRGPFLGHIGAERSRRELAEALLDPDRTIVPGFETHLLKTLEGREIRGLLLSESAETLTVLESNGRPTAVPAPSIESRHPSPGSVMPRERIESLTLRDLRSLLDYLQSLLPPGQPAGTRPKETKEAARP